MTNFACDARHLRLPRVEISYDIDDHGENARTRFSQVAADGSTLVAERCPDCKKVQTFQYKPRSMPAEKIRSQDLDRLVDALHTITAATGITTLTVQLYLASGRSNKPDTSIGQLTHLLSDRPRVTIRETQ